MKEHLLRAKYEARALVSREPILSPLHRLVVLWTQQKVGHVIDIEECAVGETTELVIDGFQGSGNSFATVAFKRTQTEPVRLAHHLHAPAQILEAVERDLPVLITIREPEHAAVSLASRWTYVTLHQALRSYAQFYEKIAPQAARFVLSTFDHTTKHLDAVVETVNDTFDTDFTVPDMEVLHREHVRPAPDPQRNAVKAKLRGEIQQPAYEAVRERARRVYDELLATAIRPRVSADS